MNHLHFILQGKGGVGKSMAAVLLTQYLQSKGNSVICADTDPVNHTFAKYKSLDVARVEIADNGKILTAKFDPLMETIVNTEADFVIDNGAATFLPLSQYLKENDIYEVMSQAGKKVFVHSVLTGGAGQADTYSGLALLLDNVDQHAKVVIWENEFWGKVNFDGHPITASKLYKEAQKAGKIAGVVKIEDRSQSDTMVGDIKAMTTNSMTLSDVMESDKFNFLAKNRLKKVIGAVFEELDKVSW
ncbi:nucleotide-binding protein [Massilia scottii]|uniref:nucleotide-binding protein n=1 Tax=Massilia scottii TaxID=3057166 RepID=UPI002796935A|nr:conjugal transfer protein TraL [Massilia sp. CCM 9029]MDQ1835207.1 conjugal transfer protein TraL [Massilia sp. CCM 9029]